MTRAKDVVAGEDPSRAFGMTAANGGGHFGASRTAPSRRIVSPLR